MERKLFNYNFNFLIRFKGLLKMILKREDYYRDDSPLFLVIIGMEINHD